MACDWSLGRYPCDLCEDPECYLRSVWRHIRTRQKSHEVLSHSCTDSDHLAQSHRDGHQARRYILSDGDRILQSLTISCANDPNMTFCYRFILRVINLKRILKPCWDKWTKWNMPFKYTLTHTKALFNYNPLTWNCWTMPNKCEHRYFFSLEKVQRPVELWWNTENCHVSLAHSMS